MKIALALALALAPALQPGEPFDAAAQQVISAQHPPSLSVAVVQNGRIVFAQAYGDSSLDPRRRATADTPYLLASVSKQFTAAAVLQLVERHRIGLDDTVSRWLPELTQASHVTVRELLTHTAGYHDYYPLDYARRELRTPQTPAAIVHKYATMPLDFPSGTRWSYSNTNYMVLALIVQRASGVPYCRYLASNIFRQAGMTQTTCAFSERPPDMAVSYTKHFLGPWRREPLVASGWGEGAGSLVSTASDVARWDIALMNGRILGPNAFAEMTTSTKLDGHDKHYGFGIFVRTYGATTYYEHGGGQAGFVSDNVFIPSRGIAIVALSNGQTQAPSAFIDAAMRKTLGAAATASPTPSMTPTPAPEPPDAARFKPAIAEAIDALSRSRFDPGVFSDDMNAYLTPQLRADARALFAPLGSPKSIFIEQTTTRGEAGAFFDLTFNGGVTHSGVIYLNPNGKVDEFSIYY